MLTEFEIIIDSKYLDICPAIKTHSCENKYVLSIVNDFENREWRYTNFQRFIWDHVCETALSHKERMSLVGSSHSALAIAAQNLRLTDKIQDATNGSELAEILLYGIMKQQYSALPVVPKIFYKQNTQDFAKGADSVHIVIEKNDDFSLWFGEAKFYNSIENARLDKIVESVNEMLDLAKVRKENQIITNIQDLSQMDINKELVDKIRAALDVRKSIDGLKDKIHIPILLLHECKITSQETSLSDEYKSKIREYHKDRATCYFTKQIAKMSMIPDYGKIIFHIILFPVPEKSKIIKAFLANAKHYKDQ